MIMPGTGAWPCTHQLHGHLLAGAPGTQIHGHQVFRLGGPRLRLRKQRRQEAAGGHAGEEYERDKQRGSACHWCVLLRRFTVPESRGEL